MVSPGLQCPAEEQGTFIVVRHTDGAEDTQSRVTRPTRPEMHNVPRVGRSDPGTESSRAPLH